MCKVFIKLNNKLKYGGVMNFTSKGILAAVCLTGSLSIEYEPEFVAADSTFSWLDHLSFGFSTAYANETEDGDEEGRFAPMHT
jgi:hypothetical protein